MKRLALILGCLVATSVSASDLASSLRPVPRPSAQAPAVVQAGPKVPNLVKSLRPLLRSPEVKKQGKVRKAALKRGAVCGDVALQGEPVGTVTGHLRGCGATNAVRIRSVSGIGLTQNAVMTCDTASALKDWVDGIAKPSLKRKGGGLDKLRVASHYSCRTRNNRKGARVSEHGKGKAIDISGFYLKDGSLITVLEGWKSRRTSKALRRMHRGACGRFGTVLGPQADRYHRDHFHFDTARHRGGPYCR